MKIKTVSPHLHNQKVLLPGMSETTVDADGFVEHPDEEMAEKLIATGQWRKPAETEEEEREEKQDISKMTLLKMKFGDLMKAADEAKYPESEWKQFTKKSEIVDYLLEKLAKAE